LVKNYVRRGKWFHYMRRVPKHISRFDKRQHVRIALKTKDEKEAQRLAAIYDNFIERYWRDLIKSGQSDDDLQKFQQASAVAKAHGFAYKDMTAILDSPLDEVLSRIEVAVDDISGKAPALLGGAKKAGLTLRECPEKFWPLCADRLLGKSEHQIRKFRNPRRAAIEKLIEAVGNLDVSAIQRSHIIQFRNWLLEKIAAGAMTGNTANKQIGYVKAMLHAVALNEEINVDFKHLFAEIRMKEEAVSRPPFEASYVQNTLLNGQVLNGLNDDARMLVYLMAETGARPSEIIGILPEEFFLDEAVPHFLIQENEIRTLKTKTSERKIPLVGIGLIVARKIAKTGLTRYWKNPDSASGTISKYLRENDLTATPKHALYSLRHTFKDRLRDAGAPEEVIDELMGHKKFGPKYGRGHMLESKHEWLQKIAFDPP